VYFLISFKFRPEDDTYRVETLSYLITFIKLCIWRLLIRCYLFTNATVRIKLKYNLKYYHTIIDTVLQNYRRRLFIY